MPYESGDPPVSLDEDSEAISIDLSEGTIYEVVAEPVDEDASVDLKLLGPSIAGLLPAASGDAESSVCFVRFLQLCSLVGVLCIAVVLVQYVMSSPAT